MDRGEKYGYVRLSESDRKVSLEALRALGRHLLADALELTSPAREIEQRTIELIAECVKLLADRGRHDAVRFLNELNEIKEGRK